MPFKATWCPPDDCSTVRYLNQTQMIGFLARDPRYYDFPKSTPYCLVTLGVRTKISKDRVLLDWHNIVVWPTLFIELITKYVRKGDWVQVIGHLRNRPFRVSQDKWTTRSRIEIGSDGKFLIMGVPKIFNEDIRSMRAKMELGQVSADEHAQMIGVINSAIDSNWKANDNREDPDGSGS